MVEINWLSAFVDMPADGFEAGTDFWLAVTQSTLSPPRGDDREFATLIPADGDPHLRVQRIQEGRPSIHLDFHVSSVADARAEAEQLGAVSTGDDDLGYAPMQSPGGLRFCFVSHHGEVAFSKPLTDPVPNIVDQVCIDIPSSVFEREARFWSALTGWESKQSQLGEFQPLARPGHIPLRILLQRVGVDGEGSLTTAHLDLSCGAEVAAVVKAHNELGAETVQVRERWTVMKDPAGQIYCLTSRDPTTGLPPS